MRSADALQSAARALARDCPAAYAGVMAQIAPLVLHCRIGHETFTLTVRHQMLQLHPLPADFGPQSPLTRHEVDLALGTQTILQLLDGAFSADAAVRLRLLWLRGHPAALALLSRGMRRFVHAATFSRGAEHVLAQYKAAHQNLRETM